MDNAHILTLLEQQRDEIFEHLDSTSVSKLHEEMLIQITECDSKAYGEVEKRVRRELEELSKDFSFDQPLKDKLAEYKNLDNDSLVEYFVNEFERVFSDIRNSGRADEIQSIFIEYDEYYYYDSFLACHGRQEYPIVEEPRYISNEFDYKKLVMTVHEGINFKPAWIECEFFERFWHIILETDLLNLFQLHSRTLLHKALDKLNLAGRLDFLIARPFTFYINEHGCEVMMLYILT